VNSEAERPDISDRMPIADFLVWAMESRRQAAALVIGPIAAGILLAAATVELGFGARLPEFMDLIPWDLLSGFHCYVLPQNVAFFCLVAAPIASALLLLTRPRLRAPSAEDDAAPPVDDRTMFIGVAGAVAALVILSGFYLFSGGWYLACQLEHAIGFVQRYVICGVIVLVSPAVSVAELALAYAFRFRLVPKPVPAEALAAMKPIGQMIAILALITLCYFIVSPAGRSSHPIARTLLFLAAGFMVAQGHLALTRLMGWISAAFLVIAAGNILTASLRAPFGLVVAKFNTDTLGTILAPVMVLTWFGFSLWILQATRRKPILAARAAAGRSNGMPWTGFAIGLLSVAISVGTFLQMEMSVGEKARRVAREKFGAQYAYQLTNAWNDRGRIYATLDGYTAHEIKKVQVDFDP